MGGKRGGRKLIVEGFFSRCTRSKWLCRRLSLRGPAWDDQRWWRGHGPVSRCWTQLSIKALCPMGWQGWALILLKEKKSETRRSGGKGRREKLDREKWEKIRERLSCLQAYYLFRKCAEVIYHSRKTKPNRWLCNLVKFATSVHRQWKLSPFTF